MISRKGRFISADPDSSEPLFVGDGRQPPGYLLRRIELAKAARPPDLVPRPAEHAAERAPETVCGSDPSIESGRPGTVIPSLIAPAHDMGCLFSSFYRIVKPLIPFPTWPESAFNMIMFSYESFYIDPGL